jgi:predicted MFS family arabinose efflux permease
MSTSRIVAWTVWIIASIFYAYQYILRVMPNIMLNDIMQQFDIDTAVFGQFSGVYYLGYSLMHIPIGIMLDHYGPKKVMSGCMLLTVVGLLPIIFAEHWIYPIIGRILIGMGSSAAILGVFKIIRMTFSEKLFPRMLSFSVMIGLFGAIYGGAPINYMCDTLGYKTVVAIFIALGIALAVLTYFIVPNLEKTPNTTVLSEFKEILTNKRVLITCISAGLMVGPMEGFVDAWGTSFLKQIYGFDSLTSSSLISIIFMGMCFGAPILTFIADKTNYIGAIIGSGIAMALCFLALIFTHLANNSVIGIFVIIGICSAYQILAIYKASTYVSKTVAGLTTAIANMIIMVFGYAFHSIIGLVITINGGITDSNAFIYGISVIPITLIIGTLGFVIVTQASKSKSKLEVAN